MSVSPFYQTLNVTAPMFSIIPYLERHGSSRKNIILVTLVKKNFFDKYNLNFLDTPKLHH